MAVLPNDDDVPHPNLTSVPGPNHPSMQIDDYEQLRYLQVKFANNLADHTGTRLVDIQSGATTLFKAIQGDEAALQGIKQAITDTMDTAGALVTNGIDVARIQEHLHANMDRMKTAYEQGDLDTIAELSSMAVIAVIDQETFQKNITHLAKQDNFINKMQHHENGTGTKAKHSPPPPAWEGSVDSVKDHDPAHMHGRPKGPVEIDRKRYEHGKSPEQVNRKQLELEPIDQHNAMPPRTSQRPPRKESGADTKEDHSVRNTVVGTAAVVGVGVAGVGGKQYLDQEERKSRVTLSDAYKGAIQDATSLSDTERNARYSATIKQHPELKEAITGYEMVRKHAADAGGITEKDQRILDLVASTTSIQILDGKIADIKVTSDRFQQATRDADQQTGPSPGL